NHLRRSGNFDLLPHLEQSALHDAINSPLQFGDLIVPAGGPFPGETLDGAYWPWLHQVPQFLCPSQDYERESQDPGVTNFGFCVGDNSVGPAQGPTRGMFEPLRGKSLKEVTDGTSRTLAIIELKIGGRVIEFFTLEELLYPSKLTERHPDKDFQGHTPVPPPLYYGRGRRWMDGAPVYTSVVTILAPNDDSRSNRSVHDLADGLYNAGSYHPGSILAAYVDGSVHVIDENVDNGDLAFTAPSGSYGGPSPYGVWGEMGSIAGEEVGQSLTR
ncbi:MAG: DUF1559 domain-containing protein, partial [Planctomycetales bacterium]|nr:DUF1559 domain-containing protein [Planctomycetales bacterium]